MAPRKQKSVEKPVSQPNDTQLRLTHNLQITLAKHYFKQLKLDYGTNIFADPNSKIFLEDVNVFEIDTRMKKEALVLLKEQRLDIFLHLINKFISSNRFVGCLMQSLLEMILVSS